MSKFHLALLFCFIWRWGIGQTELSYTLFFIDKSVSSQANAQSKKDFESKVVKLLSHRYKTTQAKIQIKFLHEKTLSDYDNAKSCIFSSELDPCKNCGAMKKTFVDQSNNKKIQNEQKKAKDNLLSIYAQVNTNTSNRYTDIWSSLEWISNLMKGISSSNKLVIYNSDMIESMPNSGRRDFHKVPLKDKNDAVKAAKQDLIWIKKNLKINSDVFKNLNIEVWPPSNSLKGSDSPFMPYYWEALFSALGAKLVWAPS